MELKYSAGLSHSCKCPAQCLAHSRPLSNSPDDCKQCVYIYICLVQRLLSAHVQVLCYTLT